MSDYNLVTYRPAMIAMSVDSHGKPDSVRVTSTCYVDEKAARRAHGERFIHMVLGRDVYLYKDGDDVKEPF